MGDKISIKDKNAVQAQISKIDVGADEVRNAGSSLVKHISSFGAALGVGATSAGDSPGTGTASVSAEGNASAAINQLQTASSTLSSWLKGLKVIDSGGSKSVDGA